MADMKAADPKQVSPEKKKSKKWIVILIVVAVVLCCIIAIILAFVLGGEFKKSVGRELCYNGAYKTYLQKWNTECSHEGKGPSCELPQDLQDIVNRDRDREEKLCDEKFPENPAD